jgi:predicted esterase
MPRFLISLLILFSLSHALSAQNTRYKDMVFSDVAIDRDLSYNLNTGEEEKKAYLFDLYQPKNDQQENRPLIIWMHGGGFKFGSKNDKGIELWGKTFAQRGYVCAGLNYTLSKKNILLHFDEVQKGCYFAVQDAKLAIAYFKKNAKRFHIDPDKIILAGNSAGGMIALQTAYSNNAELSRSLGIPDSVASTKSEERTKVAAVVNYWGGIYNLNWLKNARVPIVDIYGSTDKIMAPTHKSNSLFGGHSIHEEADELNIPNSLKVFYGYGHELEKHFNPLFGAGDETQERWLQAGQFTADFLYDKVIRYNTDK